MSRAFFSPGVLHPSSRSLRIRVVYFSSTNALHFDSLILFRRPIAPKFLSRKPILSFLLQPQKAFESQTGNLASSLSIYPLLSVTRHTGLVCRMEG